MCGRYQFSLKNEQMQGFHTEAQRRAPDVEMAMEQVFAFRFEKSHLSVFRG